MRSTFTTVFKTLCITFILIIPAKEGCSQTETYSWQNVAMGGGGFVSGIITSKTEKNLMYARTDVGGAYRWDAANSRWIPLLDWTSENDVGYQGVESLAIDPVEPNKVYMLVGTSYFSSGRSAILRSSDYGNTFAITDVTNQFKAHGNGMGRQTGEKLIVDPNKNSVLYCGTRENGLFKSTNSGATWSRVTSLNVTTTSTGNGISFVILDPSAGATGSETQTIIVGVSRNGAANLYRSDNGGATFSEVAQAPTAVMPHRATLASDRNLYITYASNDGPWNISEAGAIWKYNLSSGAWTNVTPSAGVASSFGGISVDPANPNRLVASTINTWAPQLNGHGDRFYLTTNGGASWTDVIARGFVRDANGVSWIDGKTIHWAGCIEFDPFDTKKAWVISGNGIFQTDDIDATTNVWKFQVRGLEETVALDMVSIPNGPVVSAIGDYGGFRHEDVSQFAPDHEPHMGTTSGIAYASLSPNIMLRIGHEKMYYSEDMALTWTECSRTGNDGSVAISADGKILMYSHSGNATYWSTDKGKTWTTSTGISITSARPLADPVNPSKFYAYNPSSGALLVSANGGTSFSQTGSPGAGGSKVIRAAPWREGDIWIALYNGGLTRSTNSGQAFSKISGVTYCGAVGFGKEAPGKTYPTVFIYGTVNGIRGVHRSTDEGVTWTRVNDDEHAYGGPGNGQLVQGDLNVFGRVYMSTVGRGLVYGESDQTCVPTNVVPYTKVNAEATKKRWITSVNTGSNVLLSPEAAVSGTWSWSGPEGFTSATREVTLSDIQPAQAGIYKVTYTNASGCQSSVQTFLIHVTSETVTDIRDEKSQPFQLYPNPTRSTIIISNTSEIRHIIIRDIQGRMISSTNSDGASATISIEDQPAGIYLIELVDLRNSTTRTRIVKK